MHYDEVELEEMDYDHDIGAYTYPCPCGDIFSLDPDVRLSDTLLLAMHSTFSPKRHHLSLPLFRLPPSLSRLCARARSLRPVLAAPSSSPSSTLSPLTLLH